MKSFISRIIVVAVALLFPVITNAQWVAPTLSPPSGNASVPLNLSNTGQTKLGGLTLNTGGAAYGLIVSSGNVGIGTLTPTIARLDVAQNSVVSPGTAIKFGAQGFLVSTATNISDNAYWNGSAWTNVNNAASSRMYLTGGNAGFFTSPAGVSPTWTERLTILNNGDVGVGTASPGTKLEVAGQVKITGGSPGAGKVLTSDAVGLATWTTPSSGTVGGSGTANYLPKFSAATTLANSIIYDNGTNVSIGAASPSYKLDVVGDIRAQGWLRSLGSAGWYNDSYGGGWYMTDSTWIRAYGSKPVYMSNGLDTGTASGIGCSGGLGGSYMLQVCGAAGVGAAAFFYSSDKNLKENIAPLKDSLSKVLKLDGVSFNWKEGGRPSVGVIAQDVEKVYPELVNTDTKTGLKSVEYGNLIAPLIEAVKEQQKQIDGLKAEIETLKSAKTGI